jgi:hypothetical protein
MSRRSRPKTEAARAATIAQRMAEAAAESATLNLQIAIDDMATQGASMLLQIRAKAGMSGNSVYPLASISPPSKGSPIAKPGKPYRFSFTLDEDGAVYLKWKCTNPRGSAGTIYQIYRQVDGSGQMAFLGTTGKKQFVDMTVSQGTTTIVYKIRAIRSTKIGESATFNVNFGVSSAVRKMIAIQQQMRKQAA